MKRALLLLPAIFLSPLMSTLAEEAKTFEAPVRSTFSMEANSRNPFWPIGWRPVAKADPSSTEQVGMLPPSVFHVSSITVGSGARFAIINGRIMEEGQVFGLQVGAQTYQVTVKAIQDGQVVLARRDQEIVAPLRRK